MLEKGDVLRRMIEFGQIWSEDLRFLKLIWISSLVHGYAYGHVEEVKVFEVEDLKNNCGRGVHKLRYGLVSELFLCVEEKRNQTNWIRVTYMPECLRHANKEKKWFLDVLYTAMPVLYNHVAIKRPYLRKIWWDLLRYEVSKVLSTSKFPFMSSHL